MLSRVVAVSVWLALFTTSIRASAQCPAGVATPLTLAACPPAGSQPLPAISSPFKKTSGSHVIAGNLNTNGAQVIIEGGTLTICSGVWTVTNSILGLGSTNGTPSTARVEVIVASGATLQLSNSQLYIYSNANLTNYGTIILSGSALEFVAGHSGSVLNNRGTLKSDGTIVAAGTNAGIVNYGAMAIADLTFANSGPYCCLSAGSSTSVNNLSNSGNQHPFFTSDGPVCVAMRGTYTPNGNQNVISASSSVQLCIPPAHTVPPSAHLGAAVVYSNCSGCATPLPVNPANLQAWQRGRNVLIRFEGIDPAEVSDLILQYSADGVSFSSIHRFHSRLTASEKQEFIHVPSGNNAFYRVEIAFRDGRTGFSNTARLSLPFSPTPVICWPNPALRYLEVQGAPHGATVIITNPLGQIFHPPSAPSENGVRVDIATLPPGTYRIHFAYGQTSQTVNFTKL